MSHSTIQYAKPKAKIGTPGSAGTLAHSKNALNSRKSSNGRTASNSMFERNSRNANNTTPLVTPGKSAIAERPATGNHQELKGRQQQQE